MKILSSRELFSGRLRAVQETVQRADGYEFNFELIHHPGAVVVLPVLPSGEIMLIRQYRHALRSYLLELPAGTLEKGELPETCALRELQEEIGFGAHSMTRLGVFHPAPGFCDEVQHIFLARELFTAHGEKDVDEVIELCPMSLLSLEAAIRSGEVTDAKTVAAVYLAKAQELI